MTQPAASAQSALTPPEQQLPTQQPSAAPAWSAPASARTPANRTPASRAPEHHAHSVQFLHAVTSLLSMIVCALFIVTFIAQPFRIPSVSMEPTLLVGDFLLVDKTGHTAAPSSTAGRVLGSRPIRRGDIIVFLFPPDPKIHVVKRVVALPGDRIHLINGVVYLNGQPQSEPYIMGGATPPDFFRDQFPTAIYTDPSVDPNWWSQLRREVRNGEYTVPADHYFVLGDNRSNSRDSRYWGLVPRQDIVGSPFLIYFSLRQESLEEFPTAPDDKLDHQKDDAPYSVMNLARWDRMFRVVR